LSKAGIDYGNLALTAAPFVKPSAFGISNAYQDMLEARLARQNRSPFPTVKTPGAFIDVDALQGSRLPARIVDAPATPATRLAEAQAAQDAAIISDVPKAPIQVIKQTNNIGANSREPINYRLLDENQQTVGVATFRIEDGVPKLENFFMKPSSDLNRSRQFFAAIDNDMKNYLGQNNRIGATQYNIDTSISQSALRGANTLAKRYNVNFKTGGIPKDVGNNIIPSEATWQEALAGFEKLSETPQKTTPVDMVDLTRRTPATPASRLAEAQLQRQTARTELGLNIQDIEFPPAPSPATLAAMQKDLLEAENYMRIRVKDSNPGMEQLPIEELLQNPEFKKHFDAHFASKKTLDPALEKYEQLHPTSWREMGVAQEQSGFNAQQMPDQMASLRRYFSSEFPTIQSYLSEIVSNPQLLNLAPKHSQLMSAIRLAGLNETIKDMQTLVANIDQAFAVVPPTTKPIIAYRGVGLANLYDPYQIAFYRNLKPGEIIYDPGLSSTSIDKNLASQWAAAGDDVVLIIRVPAGTKIVNPISTWKSGISELDTHAHAPGEKEMLLPRNSVFKIIKSDGKFIEVELIPNETNLPATNVRNAGAKLSETMSFTDALSNVSDPYIVQKMIARQTERTLRFANVYPEKIDIIAKNFVNNKFTSLTQEAINLFDEIDFTMQYVPLPKKANLRLVEDFFPQIKNNAGQSWLELQATSLGADAEASKNVLNEVNKQRAWIKQNPGQNPKPVFITNYGAVVPEPFINRVTQNNPYIGVIAEGQLKYISSDDYKEFFKKVIQYKEAHPEIGIADANTLINRLDEVGLLGKNDPDKIKQLFEEYKYKKQETFMQKFDSPKNIENLIENIDYFGEIKNKQNIAKIIYAIKKEGALPASNLIQINYTVDELVSKFMSVNSFSDYELSKIKFVELIHADKLLDINQQTKLKIVKNIFDRLAPDDKAAIKKYWAEYESNV